ncbi:thermonuclease family protein [Endozoicomonas sp. SM1973]|uniref:Thermonuclease family protein n=1 Tax=Spartinivicinus marinus TaxID=2994442 RepID=A0A853IAM6_9GAMM|nr:thermonuclease family protein [Spartinivicinus marinus]MCX4027487.1 thermonuclease family protein [Spartinivicinus marinus]NYZ68862.1 thermonuclease family protein [Spartinivicinus marinus]
MKKYALIVALLPCIAVGKSIKDKEFGTAVVKEVTSIYDGDTFRVNIKGWPNIVGERISIRVKGVDTPEIRGQCEKEKKLARKAKQHTVSLLRSAKKIELRNMQRGKYFRILANVYIDGKSLTDSLIKAKLARPYDGGKRQGWCK